MEYHGHTIKTNGIQGTFVPVIDGIAPIQLQFLHQSDAISYAKLIVASEEHDAVCGCESHPDCDVLDKPLPTHISHEDGDEDVWICRCGNTPGDVGFLPCSRDGGVVEPTPEKWKDDLYICNACRCVIEPSTLRILHPNLNRF